VRDSNEIEAAFTKWMARPEGTTTGVSILATETEFQCPLLGVKRHDSMSAYDPGSHPPLRRKT
jgi:hypothetical protein